jgi:hypothetical protein
MNTRVRLIDVQPNEYVYSVGGRTIDAVATAIETVSKGHLVFGPRGGTYRLTAAGARAYRILVTTKGRPLVKAEAIAVVERDETKPAPTAAPLPVSAATPSAPRPPRTAPPLSWLQIKDRQARENRSQWPNGCGLCGEPADDEMGEFWLDTDKHAVTAHTHTKGDPEDTRVEHSVIAHAQCGIDAGLEMA